MSEPSPARPAVVVIGGGYAGISVAKSLDDVASVVLVEPKDAFVHNVAALRALVDPSWLPRIYLPYGGLLSHGRVVQDRAAKVDAGRVALASGEELPAGLPRAGHRIQLSRSRPRATSDRTVDAHEKTLGTHAALAAAARVLLVGAGPVGIELAGEIKAVWPSKQVTLRRRGRRRARRPVPRGPQGGTAPPARGAGRAGAAGQPAAGRAAHRAG